MAERFRAEHETTVRERFDHVLSALGMALDRWHQTGDRSGFRAWLREYGGMTEAEVVVGLEEREQDVSYPDV